MDWLVALDTIPSWALSCACTVTPHTQHDVIQPHPVGRAKASDIAMRYIWGLLGVMVMAMVVQ